MRRVILTSIFAIAIIAAAAAESTRTPGAYTSLTAANAAACARACADDGICMAWNFERDNRCDLSAVVPASLNSTALAAGFAPRAPAYLQPRTPDVHVAAIEITTPPEAEPLPAAADEAPAQEVDDTMLLGGPLEGDLRQGLR